MDRIIKLKETLEIFLNTVYHYIDLCLYRMYVCMCICICLFIGTYICKGFADISAISRILCLILLTILPFYE